MANKENIRLIILGDMHDSKANLRGECVKAIMNCLERCNEMPIVIVANHDRINEKSPDHSLEFIRDVAQLITDPTLIHPYGWVLPYYHDPLELKKFLKKLAKGSKLLMHQGLISSNSGDYINDKSAITTEDVASFIVTSGHYHARQTIQLPENGVWNYCGNPFTLNYGEASDLPKGFQILMNDSSLEFVPTDLRKHVVIELDENTGYKDSTKLNSTVNSDLVWVKVRGSREFLNKMNKQYFKTALELPDDFKLTLEPIDLNITAPTKTLTSSELLDSLIDSVDTTQETKDRLKTTWKSLCES